MRPSVWACAHYTITITPISGVYQGGSRMPCGCAMRPVIQ